MRRERGTCATLVKTYEVRGAYGVLPTPKREGYTSLGWWTEATGGEQVTADSIVPEGGARTLYAHWGNTN